MNGKAESDAQSTQQLLSLSWYDSVWIPALDRNNVMDYFSQRSNPFYDRTCNNEIVRMQRSDPAQLVNMTGIEYLLLHVQDPVLYIIRKVRRLSPEKVVPIADYYILMGVVYQCPDIMTLINCRLLSALSLVKETFSEAVSYARYDPNKGHYWEFPDDKKTDKDKKHTGAEEEPREAQRKKVDFLLNELIKKFPPKAFIGKEGGQPAIVSGDKSEGNSSSGGGGGGGGGEIGGKEGGAGNQGGGLKRTGQFSSNDKTPDAKRKRM